MPYIKPEDRGRFDAPIDALLMEIATPGEFNYVISSIIYEILRRRDTSYSLLNELIGVLECAKLELYRRKAVPYEDIKKAENGDV